MVLTVELYKKEENENHVYITVDDGASGADYKYETADDIGKKVAFYLTNYYPDIVENPKE